MRGHATFLAMMALDALGEPACEGLPFLDAWRDDQRVYEWIDRLDWTNPWRGSNWVEWIGYWLLADAGLSAADVPLPQHRYPPGFTGLLQWLEDHQDPETGFWGEPPVSGDQRILHQMAGAYHHYVFYYATGRPIRGIERIVDHTLALQQPDGLFFPDCPGSNPCVDLDAIDILANMHRLADYRRRDIEASMRRAILALLANQRRDGAFAHCVAPDQLHRAPFGIGLLRLGRSAFSRIGRALTGRAETADSCYAGCSGMPFGTRQGDMFSQWFRPLAIALAATVLGPEECPVWWDFGFRRQITQGWWPGQVHRQSSSPVPASNLE